MESVYKHEKSASVSAIYRGRVRKLGAGCAPSGGCVGVCDVINLLLFHHTTSLCITADNIVIVCV